MPLYDGRIQLGADKNTGTHFDNRSGEIGDGLKLENPEADSFMKKVIETMSDLDVKGMANRNAGIEALSIVYGVSEKTIRRRLDDLKAAAFHTAAVDVKHDKRHSRPIRGIQVRLDESKGDFVRDGKVHYMPSDDET